MMIVATTVPLAGCTVNLGTEAGSDDTSTTGDGDGDSGGDGDGDASGDTGDGDGDTENCPEGTLDCPCYGNNTCNDGLECNAGICEPASGDGDGDTSGDGDGDTGDGDGDGDGDVVDLADWTKKRDIIIENQWVAPLDDYQTLMVLDWDSDMQVDFEDLRFTSEADDTLLPFWIEDFAGAVNATLFVRVPSIPAGDTTTIHMYYGNPNATSASDGVATFDFFDDFDGPDLDESIWSATAANPFQPDYIQLETGAIYTDDFVLHDTGRIEAKIRYNIGTGGGLAVGLSQGVQPDLGRMQLWCPNLLCRATAYAMGMEYIIQAEVGMMNQGVWSHISIAKIVGQLIFSHNRSTASTFNVNYPGDDYFVTLGHLYGSAAGQMSAGGMEVDFVLRRAYAAVEPDYMVGVEEDI
jgi:hypothetical protein